MTRWIVRGISSDESNGPSRDSGRRSTTAPDDANLLDAYSQAVVGGLGLSLLQTDLRLRIAT
jgi:hypothetical protein